MISGKRGNSDLRVDGFIGRHEGMKEEYRDDIEEIDDDYEQGGIGQWLADNLRVIISVLIVLLLAFGIYSYSQRSDVRTAANDVAGSAESAATSAGSALTDAMKKVADKTTDGIDKAKDSVAGAAKDAADKVADTAKTAGSVATKDAADSATKQATKKIVTNAKDAQTDDAFVMVANRGDGRTHLARRALAGYLSVKNVDGLTAAHKVFIEDYLQKAASGSRNLAIGQSVSFSKDLIAQAVTRAQGLSDAQVNNLQKFVR